MAKLKILIVEDEFIVANDIEETLISLNYEVQSSVATAKAAIEEVERCLPDIILMDIILKGNMTGIEAANIIRQKHDVPIIYLTANADLATIEKAKVSLPYGYIIKPFTEKDLQTNIEIARFKFESDLKSKIESDQFNRFFKLDEQNDEHLIVESVKGLEKISPAEVYYIERSEGNSTIHFLDEEMLLKKPIDELEDRFLNFNFVRVNPDFLVNMEKVFLKKLPEIIIADKMTVISVDNDKQEILQAIKLSK